jgi:hypothetical protein
MINLLLITNPIITLLEYQPVGKALADGFECEVEVELLEEPGGFFKMGEGDVFVLGQVMDS